MMKDEIATQKKLVDYRELKLFPGHIYIQCMHVNVVVR